MERVGLTVGGLLITGVVLEFLLQIASLSAGPRAISRLEWSGRIVLLCVGDSCTYGLHCLPDEAYPTQLQKCLERRKPGRYRVLNRGLPGMNTTQIAASLELWIARYLPHVVVFCAGANNYWNRSEDGVVGSKNMRHGFLSRLRIHRLGRILWFRLFDLFSQQPSPGMRREIERQKCFADGPGIIQHDAATGELVIHHRGNPQSTCRTDEEVLAGIADDLLRIQTQTADRGIRLVLVTYAACPLPGRRPRFQRLADVSDELVAFGEHHGIEVVDVRPRFVELLKGGVPREWYFLHELEGHPNPRGYEEVATLVANTVADLTWQAGGKNSMLNTTN